jgi:transcriptional regulator with XRE-family HTH domain
MNKHIISDEDRQALLRWKKETRISNEEIGRICGVSKISVAKWINGKTHSMKIKSFVAIAADLARYPEEENHNIPIKVHYRSEFKSLVLGKLLGDEELLKKLLATTQDLYDERITKTKFLEMLKKYEYLDPMVACIIIVILDLNPASLKFNGSEVKLLYGIPLVRRILGNGRKLLIKVPGH